MLLLDRQSVAAVARRGCTNRAQLRLRADGRLVELPFGKTTIGSSPRCDVRIQKPGIEPVHCLIVHGAEGLSVRRWAADAQLNGAPFDEAQFNEGDCLALAGVELELVASQSPAIRPAEVPPAEWAPKPATSDELLDTMQESVDAMAGWDTAPIDEEVAIDQPVARRESAAECEPELPFTAELNEADAAEYVFRELQAACANSRGRSRKLLAALRTKQHNYDQLVERFNNVDGQLAEINRLRAEWERSQSSREVERRDWELQLQGLRQQVGEWEHRLADQTHCLAELQQGLAIARLNESPVAMRCEAVGDENTSPSKSQVFSWLPVNAPPQPAADDLANILPQSTSGDDSSDQQSASVRKSSSTWHSPSTSEVWSTPDRATAETGRDASQWGEAAPHNESTVADVVNANASYEGQSAWAVESTPVTNSLDENVADVIADENPFAELSIRKQGAASQQPSHTETAGSAPAIAVEPAPIWGSQTISEIAEESADVESPAPATEAPIAAAHSKPWAQPAENSASEGAEVVRQKPQPTSFIERYSHMFAEESAEESPTPAAAPQPLAASPAISKSHTMGVVRNAASEPNSSVSDDEESIEQYMAKLLERVRGDAPARAASQAPPTPPPAPEETSTGKSMSLEQLAPVADEPVEREPMSEAEATVELATWDVSKRKSAAPASATDMGALRALANQTARRAIGKHQLTKHRRDAVTKVIVSTLAGVTSLWLMMLAPNWRDIQFIAACVSLIVAAYWAGEAFRSLLESMRAAAYDGREDYSQESDSDYRPAMPIDVEDRF